MKYNVFDKVLYYGSSHKINYTRLSGLSQGIILDIEDNCNICNIYNFDESEEEEVRVIKIKDISNFCIPNLDIHIQNVLNCNGYINTFDTAILVEALKETDKYDLQIINLLIKNDTNGYVKLFPVHEQLKIKNLII